MNGEHPAELRPFDSAVIAVEGHFGARRPVTSAHRQEMDLERLVGRAISASYVPKQGPRYERLATLLGELFERCRDASGRAAMLYETRVWLAERR